MKQVVIIGAGPAGLTAAYELIKQTGIRPIVIEGDCLVGGISKTVNYNGNRIDIGGHRFFSKSQRVKDFWRNFLPEENPDYSPLRHDQIMLKRNRLSRILFSRKFYDYPLSLEYKTLRNLGISRTVKIGASYLSAQLQPVKPENSLADFFINRFGQELYATFFRDYTEKVWGVSCTEIPRDWGAQRVKGLSVAGVLRHAIKKQFAHLKEQQVETSLIESFHYPKFGPGQLWEKVADYVEANGGQIRLEHTAEQLVHDGGRITGVCVRDKTGQRYLLETDCLLSSAPVKELAGMLGKIPDNIGQIAGKLPYRDFITVGVLVRKDLCKALPDNWIYIQEPDCQVGRIQVFNNWSPYLVKDKDYLWLGLEYFCQENDSMWNMEEANIVKLATQELVELGFVEHPWAVADSTVIRVKKAYPAYFGTYNRFAEVKAYLDSFPNLLLIGRNGQHRYNNMDHSMLTAMTAIDYLTGKIRDKEAIWQVNTEENYHEAQ